MSVFDQLVGQESAAQVLLEAAAASRAQGGGGSVMSQAWLFTGPPGSGRSLAARMFAAALECTGEVPGCGECHECRTVMAGTHPDVVHLGTTGSVITIEETRSLVAQSFTSPGAGRMRVMILEDADRMPERTTNVLLKAIEEPPAFTVWILCTPAPGDVLPTIRSRCRHLRLRVPPADAVAGLLAGEGYEYAQALDAAHAALSHVGIARALLADEQVRSERERVLTHVSKMRSISDALFASFSIVDAFSHVEAQRKVELEEKLAQLRQELGIDEAQRMPPALRSQLKDFSDTFQRATTRARKDYIDRNLLTVLSFYRDVLVTQLGAEVELANTDHRADVERVAGLTQARETIARMDSIATARTRLQGNADPQLLLDALFIRLLLSA